MASRKNKNRAPFSGASPDSYYAMPRQESRELSRILSASGSLVLIEGPRRIGKTMLARNASSAAQLVETNLYGARSAEGCESLIAAAIEDFTGKSPAMETATSANAGVFGFGASLQSKSKPAGDLLKKSFDALAKKARKLDKPVVLFIDEAQTILELDDGMNFAKRLRTELQRSLDYLSGVFAGSNSEALKNLHSHKSSPFYKQCMAFPLGPLPPAKFFQWARKRLRTREVELEEEAFTDLLGFCRHVPGDVQRTLETAFYLVEKGATIDSSVILEALDRISLNQKADALPLLNRLSDIQLSLYAMLSTRGRLNAEIPSTGKVAQRLLGTTSGGIASALEALSRKELIAHWNGDIYPDSPFLEKIATEAYPDLFRNLSLALSE